MLIAHAALTTMLNVTDDMTDSPDPPHGYYISPHRQAYHAAAATLLLLLLPLLLHAARAMHCRFCALLLPYVFSFSLIEPGGKS